MNHVFPSPRTGAVAGFLSAACFVPGFLMLPTIMRAIDATALDQGLAQIGAHSVFPVVCQSLWILSDIGAIVVGELSESCRNDRCEHHGVAVSVVAALAHSSRSGASCACDSWPR